METWRLYGTLALPRLVGRENILKEIKASLPPENVQVIYLKGPGGIGKTRLLLKALRIAKELAREHNLVVPEEPVDFYHYETHSVEGAARAMYVTLPGAAKSFFSGYDAGKREMRGARLRGDHRRAAGLHSEMLSAFEEDLGSLVEESSLVLAFDTLEVLGHSEAGEEVLGWLTSPLASMQGKALVLLAGRPDPEQEAQLRKLLGERLRILNVEGLSAKEITEYLAALADMLETQGERRAAQRLGTIPPEMQETIAILTGGHPILVALTADLVLGLGQVPEIFQESPDALRALDAEALAQRQQATREKIVNHLRSMSAPLQETLELLSLARKGMSAELLAHFQPSSLTMARDRLGELRRFSFVKVRPADQRVYLHDEVYELLEKNPPDPGWRVAQVGAIAGWYEDEIEKVGEELRKARERKEIGVLKLQQGMQDLEVEHVHYLLRKDAAEGVARFVELSVDAYLSWDLSWDAHLEGELGEFLWGRTDSPQYQALKWEITLARARRALRQGQLNEVHALLNELESQTSPGSLHTAHRDLWRAESYLQQGDYGEAEEAFARAGMNLGGAAIAERDRFKARLQALLYDRQGYMFNQQGKSQAAVDAYRSAIPLLRWLKIEDGMINVLKNLAFALAQSGDIVEAQRLIDDAMESAGRHGTYYMQGLCLNTKSLVAIRAGELEQAVEPARDALALFREIGNLRGEGLVCIALAEAYRRLALEHRGDGARQRAEIQEAMDWGEQAIQIFRDKVPELVRHIEALIEAGSACRDLVRIERETFEVPANWLKGGAEEVKKGREYLEKAAKLAEEPLPTRAVDARVNLAMLSLLLEDYEECDVWLEQAEAFVDQDYKIEKGSAYPPVGGETPGFWLSLGKLYQVRMQSLWNQRKEAPSGADIEQICEWMVLSMAYDELFDPASFGARRGQDDLYFVVKTFPVDRLQWIYRSVWRNAREYGLPRSREVPQERTMAIKFLERYFGPSNQYVREEELARFWT